MIHEALKKYWGFDTLRPLQDQAVEASLQSRDSLVVMPTGGGKSLCFQLPAVVSGELTLVVSPLIALMKDQVDGLRLIGYPAAALNSSVSASDAAEIERQVASGGIKLLYTSPERVLLPGMLELLSRASQGKGVARVAVDEAHCISNWGHDFRPEYRQLSRLREAFPGASLHALTATATEQVQEDIIRQLRLKNPVRLVGGFDRPNLSYRVVPKIDPVNQIAEAIRPHREEAAIVYCLSRKDTESVADALTKKGIPARAYHAGMDASARAKLSEDFALERLNVVVATVAFGMGIDRSNVRIVVHESMPRSIEAYQQETGRAGRDGLPSSCLMLYSPADFVRWRRLMDDSPAERKTIEAALLDEVRKFASGRICRHAFLTRYFGQEYAETEEGCGACDLCIEGWTEVPNSTRRAQQIIATVLDLERKHGGFGYGAHHLAYILTGAKRKEVIEKGHHELRGYGAMAGVPASSISDWVGQLVDQGYLKRDLQYGTVTSEEAGQAALRTREDITLRDVPLPQTTSDSKSGAPLFAYDSGLFEKLRSWRREEAERLQVPAYIVFADAVLMEIAARRPSHLASLQTVSGIGSRKIEQYGQAVIDLIDAYAAQKEVARDVPVLKSGAAPRPPSPPKTTRAEATYEAFAPCFEEGLNIEDAAARVGLSLPTAVRYLQIWADRTGSSLNPWITPELEARVNQVFDDTGDEYLKPVYEELGGEVPYELLRLVQARRRQAAT